MATHFIFKDNELYDPPADKASVKIIHKTMGAIAWAGSLAQDVSISGDHVLSYEITECSFDEFLDKHGYSKCNHQYE